MRKLIDEQAAIDTHCELCGDRHRCNCDICPDVEVFQLIPAVQPEPQWILCSENLPTKEGHYLCSFKEPSLIDRIHVNLAYWTGGRWYGYLANEIKAWMPLPEPYIER